MPGEYTPFFVVYEHFTSTTLRNTYTHRNRLTTKTLVHTCIGGYDLRPPVFINNGKYNRFGTHVHRVSWWSRIDSVLIQWYTTLSDSILSTVEYKRVCTDVLLAIITLPMAAVEKYCNEYVCVSVCVSVCPRGYLRNHSYHTCDPYQIFVHVAYGRGSVLVRQVDKIPRGGGCFGEFPSPLTKHCTAYHLEPIQKRLNRSRCRLGWWLGLTRGSLTPL